MRDCSNYWEAHILSLARRAICVAVQGEGPKAGGIILSGIQKVDLTNVEYFHLRVPCFEAPVVEAHILRLTRRAVCVAVQSKSSKAECLRALRRGGHADSSGVLLVLSGQGGFNAGQRARHWSPHALLCGARASTQP